MTRARDVADTQDNIGGAVPPYVAGKNAISNGAMEICQRSASQTFGTGGGGRYYSADRWFTEDYTWSAGSNITVSNDSAVYPPGFSKSIKIATGATGLTVASGGVIYLKQFIEGFNAAPLYNQSAVTLSFWVRSSITGTYSILFDNGTWGAGTSTRGLILEYVISSANTWEKKTLSFNLATGTSAGTWNSSNGDGLNVQFNLGANADRVGNTYLNNWATWSTYQVQSSASTQWATNANATFYLTGVQLEAGSVATPFSRAGGSISGELALCQRYYFRTTGGGAFQPLCLGFASSTTNVMGYVQYPVTMRTSPSSIDFSQISCNDSTVGNPVSAVAFSGTEYGPQASTLNFTTSGMTTFRPTKVLQYSTSAGYLGLSAEL